VTLGDRRRRGNVRVSPSQSLGTCQPGGTGSGGSSSRMADFSLLSLCTTTLREQLGPLGMLSTAFRAQEWCAEMRDTHTQHFPPRHTISWLRNALWPLSIGGDLLELCQSWEGAQGHGQPLGHLSGVPGDFPLYTPCPEHQTAQGPCTPVTFLMPCIFAP